LVLVVGAGSLRAVPPVDEARVLLEDGRTEEAETLLLEALDADDSNHQAHALLSGLCLRKQDHKGAGRYAEKAGELAPDSREFRKTLRKIEKKQER
jgi:Tfp pilus assembly protein PilF